MMDSILAGIDLRNSLVIATTIAVVMWYLSDLTGVQRLTSTALVWLISFVIAALTIRFLDGS